MKKFNYLILFIFIFSLYGCTTKEIVKYEYIYPPLPTLKTYEFNKTLDFGDVYNNKGKVCIVKWNSCIPKEEFEKIVNIILKLKRNNDKLNFEIKRYNDFIKRFYSGKNRR